MAAGRLASLVELFRLAFDPVERFVRVTNLTGEPHGHENPAKLDKSETSCLGHRSRRR